MRHTKGPERCLQLPALTPQQQLLVIGKLTAVLQMMTTKYVEALGERRISEFEQFRDDLLKGIKNADLTGTSIDMEPAVIETVHTLVEGIMPVITRYDGGLNSQGK